MYMCNDTSDKDIALPKKTAANAYLSIRNASALTISDPSWNMPKMRPVSANTFR